MATCQPLVRRFNQLFEIQKLLPNFLISNSDLDLGFEIFNHAPKIYNFALILKKKIQLDPEKMTNLPSQKWGSHTIYLAHQLPSCMVDA